MTESVLSISKREHKNPENSKTVVWNWITVYNSSLLCLSIPQFIRSSLYRIVKKNYSMKKSAQQTVMGFEMVWWP